MAPFTGFGDGLEDPRTGTARLIDFLGGVGPLVEHVIRHVIQPPGDVMPHWNACRENERESVS